MQRSWGYGIYSFVCPDTGKQLSAYGKYGTRPEHDPFCFTPDLEVCYPEEIEAWERAKQERREQNA